MLDHTQDLTGAEQWRLTQLYSPPGYVKQASASQLYELPDDAPRTCYAYPVRRLYPIHTKAATWMSQLFFLEHGHSLDDEISQVVQDNLTKAAEYWQMGADLHNLVESYTDANRDNPNRIPREHFALVRQAADGSEIRQFPLRNSAEIAKAASWFVSHRDAFSIEDRRTMSRRILARADELDVPFDRIELDKSAGYGYCVPESVREGWIAREDAVTTDEFKQAAIEARQLVESIEPATLMADLDIRQKIADAMESFDVAAGLLQNGRRSVPPPEESLFPITPDVIKSAAASAVFLPDGSIYDKQAVSRLKLSDMETVMGATIANHCREFGSEFADTGKLAAVAGQFTQAESAAFSRLATMYGIQPQAKSNRSVSMTTEAAEAAARDYWANAR